MFEVLEDFFGNHKTEDIRLKRFADAVGFIPPIPYVVGKRLKKVVMGSTIKAQYTGVEDQFVSLHCFLQKMFALPNALNDILSYVRSSKPDEYSNIMQGPR